MVSITAYTLIISKSISSAKAFILSTSHMSNSLLKNSCSSQTQLVKNCSFLPASNKFPCYNQSVINWIFIPPKKIHVLKIPAPMWQIILERRPEPSKWISALTKDIPESSLALFLSCEDYSEKSAIYEGGRGSSLDTGSAMALNLDFRPPELWEINICCLSHPVCGFITAAQTD